MSSLFFRFFWSLAILFKNLRRNLRANSLLCFISLFVWFFLFYYSFAKSVWFYWFICEGDGERWWRQGHRRHHIISVSVALTGLHMIQIVLHLFQPIPVSLIILSLSDSLCVNVWILVWSLMMECTQVANKPKLWTNCVHRVDYMSQCKFHLFQLYTMAATTATVIPIALTTKTQPLLPLLLLLSSDSFGRTKCVPFLNFCCCCYCGRRAFVVLAFCAQFTWFVCNFKCELRSL